MRLHGHARFSSRRERIRQTASSCRRFQNRPHQQKAACLQPLLGDRRGGGRRQRPSSLGPTPNTQHRAAAWYLLELPTGLVEACRTHIIVAVFLCPVLLPPPSCTSHYISASASGKSIWDTDCKYFPLWLMTGLLQFCPSLVLPYWRHLLPIGYAPFLPWPFSSWFTVSAPLPPLWSVLVILA